jgi:hypothetical protein
MEHKQTIAVEIALQSRVFQTCPVHHQIYCDEEADPSGAFALAVELVRLQTPYVQAFDHDAHALTDLLSETIGSAPTCCPYCPPAAGQSTDPQRVQAA